MSPYSLLVVILISVEAFSKSTRSLSRKPASKGTTYNCTTPTRIEGNCAPIEKCPVLWNLRNNTSGMLDSVIEQFINRTHCPGENNICCISCGTTRQLFKYRISKGNSSQLGEWPWIAALGYGPSDDIDFLCGGSLVSHHWVLTAAHCIMEHNRPVTIRLGDLDLRPDVQDNSTAQDIPIDEIFVHEGYDPENYGINDIALIRLKYPAQFTVNVRPICLPIESIFKNQSFYSNKRGDIYGYGSTEFGMEKSDTLLQGVVNFVDHDTCKNNYANITGKTIKIDDRVICATGENNVDACTYDSGGPLSMSLNKVNHLIGVVSYGKGCGEKKFPGVYTKVPQFIEWIRKTMINDL